ncbi:hypothetical protein [Streptomyces albus]|uniref:hypothetical protein n=1 Tax=Streptomyces albus TaxID=1888 RepID=UPI00340B7E5E
MPGLGDQWNRGWSEQLDLVAETGADLDAAALFRALEAEVAPRAEVEAAVRLLDELLPPGDDEAEAEMRRRLAGRQGPILRTEGAHRWCD